MLFICIKDKAFSLAKIIIFFRRVKFSREIITLGYPFLFWKRKNVVKELFAVKRKIKPLAETTPSAKTV